MSNPLPACPFKASFQVSRALNKDEYVAKTVESIQQCVNYWAKANIDIAAYNTTESANDIEDLRRAVRASKISLWGISYGSHLAFEYVRLYDRNIDRMVLASLEGPDETIKFPAQTEKFIDEICSRANDNYGYQPRYPALKRVITDVHNGLKNKPVICLLKNKQGKVDSIGISNFELQATIATFYLKNPSDQKKLPKLYLEMSKGDFARVAPSVAIMKRYVLNRVDPMPFSMDMQSNISPKRNAIVKSQLDKTVLGSAINFLSYDWMNTIQFPRLPDEFRVLKTNNVKTLLLSGTLDGRTYGSSAVAIAKSFRKGKLVVIDNAGHDLFMQSPVIGELILSFFKGNPVQEEKITIKPTPFE